ncbi:aminoacyl-tRNA hydrolase [Tersicoccus phoenicis]|uniref:Aminoacyl-tRNA hydrolase n=1 Tax=Tersicoccus phoenicis TaxID=554083 RepID=A0A1R1L674_9MICC|nr:alternative ribosome rescue aminoacyl-tRNA hydrolase ArfB [Tersicoccus phoenicis]OMH23023.1 aminoacyl-tRNA hydrolase [Tersicoccus phoenicis]
MDDLQVPPGPGVPHGLTVSGSDLVERFSHASGPGGQGVNTADSRVQLSLDLATAATFDDALRRRLLTALSSRLSGTVLTVESSEHRSQYRNRAAARDRLASLLREGAAPPIPRRPTSPTRGSRRRRAEAKRRRAEVKQSRRRPGTE